MKRKANRTKVFSKRERNWVQMSSSCKQNGVILVPRYPSLEFGRKTQNIRQNIDVKYVTDCIWEVYEKISYNNNDSTLKISV